MAIRRYRDVVAGGQRQFDSANRRPRGTGMSEGGNQADLEMEAAANLLAQQEGGVSPGGGVIPRGVSPLVDRGTMADRPFAVDPSTRSMVGADTAVGTVPITPSRGPPSAMGRVALRRPMTKPDQMTADELNMRELNRIRSEALPALAVQPTLPPRRLSDTQPPGMKAGGLVKSKSSSGGRGNGIATRGKTKGTMR